MLLDDTLESSLNNSIELSSFAARSPAKAAVPIDAKSEDLIPLTPVVRCPVQDAVVADTEELDLEKIEFIVDQQVAGAEINSAIATDIMVDTTSLDNAEFILQDDSSAVPNTDKVPPTESIPTVSATPIKILQASWV